ncbi:MAG: AAA family ATPase [Chloroflexi bacterium]|nr:AAA family ATPase [Chloroflexota bacterium]
MEWKKPGDELKAFIRARYPLVYVVSHEEPRVEHALSGIARELNKRFLTWSVTTGLIDEHGRSLEESKEPVIALDIVMKAAADPTLFLFKDFHPYFSHPLVTRKMREAVQYLQPTLSSLIMLSPMLAIPPELGKLATIFDFPLPNYSDMEELFRNTLKMVEGRIAVNLTPEQEEQMIAALLGLTLTEAENALARAVIRDSRLDAGHLDMILNEKSQIIRKSGVLEFYPVRETLKSIGGLEFLKQWLLRKSACFSAQARDYGLDTPRGLLLMGVPGCGKSLVAKSISSIWKMPLVRFDLGRVFGSLVGESEQNMRRAIQLAESISPAILWIDEIEKGFAGTEFSLDSGVTKRVFGTFITWMQEKQKPVFVVATANDIKGLPPELLRKGRFDEIFFIDLPDIDERKEIFGIHLEKRRHDPGSIDMKKLASASEGFSGADIEELVKSGLERAFLDGIRKPETADFLEEIKLTQPLSVTMGQRIEQLREWATGRARPASDIKNPVPVESEEDWQAKRQLDL